MTLRLRLLLGYGYLVALLLLATSTSVVGFLHLSAGIDRVLEENYESIRMGMSMLESLERQDSETLSALLTDERNPRLMEQLEEDFLAALKLAEGNVTEERETEVIDGIARAYAEYRLARNELLSAAPERLLAAYNQNVFPAFVGVKRGVRELLDVNQEAMVTAEREAKTAALRNGAWLGFLVALALLSLVFLSRAMQAHILSRLGRLRNAVGRMAVGSEDRRLTEDADDELGAMARGINALLDRHEAEMGDARARLAQSRRLLLGALGTLGRGAALVDVGGRLRVGEGVSREVLEWIRGEGKERIERGETSAEPHRVDGYEVRLLTAARPDRVAGWLVVPVATAGGGD